MTTEQVLIGCGSIVLSSLSVAGGYLMGGKKKQDIDKCEKNQEKCQSSFVDALKEMKREDREIHKQLFEQTGDIQKQVSEIAGGLRAQGFIK